MKTQNVILVDDQASYRGTLKNILKIVGDCNVIAEASNGKEYLELLETHKPDITFMDVEMPIMGGIEATQKALEKNKDLVIIGLSLYDSDGYIDQLINAGARGYLLKLSNNYDLFKTILKYPEAEVFFSEKIKKRKEEKKVTAKAEKIKKILIVDDFETNTIVVASALKTAGYEVLKATSASEAMKIAFNQEGLDLIIADYNMPKKNGAQMIKEIKNFPGFEKIPAVILSSDNSKEKKDAAREAGALGWIKKPFQLTRFLNIVESIIS